MAHKVHPKAYRIQGIADWNIRGFYRKNTAQYFEEDFRIKEFLSKNITKVDFSAVKKDVEHFLEDKNELKLLEKNVILQLSDSINLE